MRVLLLAALASCLCQEASAFSSSFGFSSSSSFSLRSSTNSLSRSAARLRPSAPRSSAVKGLRMQLGADKSDDQPQVEISEEMMMLMALQQQQALALPKGSKVIVFGALGRIGQLVVRYLGNSDRYIAAVQTSEGYENQMKFTVDGEELAFPAEALVYYDEIPADVDAAILCVEEPTDPDTMKQVLSLGLPIKKFVLLSRIGVDSMDDWKVKINPFLKAGKWAELESTIKECADLYNFDFSIVRVGNLQGGPFFDSNRDFADALEQRIFDTEATGCVVKQGDQEDGKTGRDVAAELMVQCLARAEAANKVLSVTCWKSFREDAVQCEVDNQLALPANREGKPRSVKTPAKGKWDAAFEKALN